ncbi:MAG TPA: DUF3592 domain-containing protein [Thermoanaerobaculia bacterium]
MDRFDIWGVACILVACGFLVSALRIYTKRKKFLATAEPTAGTVIEVHVRGVGRNALSFPVFEFRTSEGTVHRAESMMGSGFRGFQVGETVAVRYDPADPSKAEVDSFAVLWGLVLLRGGFAVLFLGMGVVGLVL